MKLDKTIKMKNLQEKKTNAAKLKWNKKKVNKIHLVCHVEMLKIYLNVRIFFGNQKKNAGEFIK